ncbi:DUF4102 domain-containing protein [Serratia symbiotica]|uniref:DUF4102 domain-containing protein n=1 Tax=Serratia symbiotica TaxID=138074 RepID=A0A7D5STN0_9GAMM|nr:DUF4102 domain-containing protein [Serratia symbiotica]
MGSPEVSDADGLSARISPKGVINFQFRYRWNGKAQRLGIGRYPAVTLKDARSITSELRICSGQLKLATALEFFQYRFSDSFGGNPPLYSCGLSAL